jgi:hypothetical protein
MKDQIRNLHALMYKEELRRGVMLHLGQFEELAKLPPLDEHMYCILTNDETALRAEWKYRHGTMELMKPPALRRVDTRTESKARQNRTTRTTRLSQAVEESREREATLMQEVELALLVEEERPRRPKDLTRSL